MVSFKLCLSYIKGTYVWTEGWMNGHIENLPILQDFVPYRGRCPAAAQLQPENCIKRGKGTADHTSKGSYRSKKKIIKVWMMMKWMGELFLLTLPLLALPLLNLPSLTFPSLSFHSLTLPLLPLLSLALPGLSTSFCVSRFYPHCWEFWVIDKLLKLLKYCFVIFSLLLPS